MLVPRSVADAQVAEQPPATPAPKGAALGGKRAAGDAAPKAKGTGKRRRG